MNEAEPRAEHIDTVLKAAGWGVVEGMPPLPREERASKVKMEISSQFNPKQLQEVFIGFQKFLYVSAA